MFVVTVEIGVDLPWVNTKEEAVAAAYSQLGFMPGVEENSFSVIKDEVREEEWHD